MPNWVLPEHIADVLPLQAAKMEKVRRKMLDTFASYGYDLVIPPMLEYLDTLLTGVGRDTEMKTFKLVDQLSGKTMGVRADITTQVARIDSQMLKSRQSVTRLCYAGSVLHTRPSGLFTTREPIQAGAEIFGYAGIEADQEIQALAMTALAAAGVRDISIDLTHVEVLRSIISVDPIAQLREAQLFDLLEAKDMPALTEVTRSFMPETREALLVLPQLYGDVSVVKEARKALPDLDGVKRALDEIEYLAERVPCGTVSVDLADMHGYHYHNGIMFAAYVKGFSGAVARGGRYDHVAESFGSSRPATGFSVDIRELCRMTEDPGRKSAIYAGAVRTDAVNKKIRELRAQGETVICDMPGMASVNEEFICDRIIVEDADNGVVIKQISKK